MAEKIEIEVEKEDSKYPEFKAPDGLDLSDLRDGEEKEVLAKIRKKPDGVVCVVEVDGFPLGKGEDYAEEQDEEEAAETDYASQIMSRAGLA